MKNTEFKNLKVSDIKKNVYAAEFVTITPEVAKSILEKEDQNFRVVSKRWVNVIQKDMENGTYHTNGESIKFSKDGSLIDGQHRLTACVNSGLPMKTVVIFGAISEGLDTGAKRNIAQTLKNLGYDNASSSANVAQWCIAHDLGDWSKLSTTHTTITRDQIIEFVSNYHNEIRSALALARKPEGSIHYAKTSMASIFLIGSGLSNPEENPTAIWFSKAIEFGSHLEMTDAALLLRNMIMAQTNHKKMTTAFMRYVMSFAWNQTVKGLKTTKRQMQLRGTKNKIIVPKKILLAD